MRRKIISVLLLSLLCLTLHASPFKIGLEVSGNYNFLKTYNIFPSSSESGRWGFDGAIVVEYGIFDWLSVDSGVRYLMKNTEFRSQVDLYERDIQKIRSFIEFPLSLRFSFKADRFRLFAGAGGYVGVWVGMIYSGKDLDIISNGIVNVTDVVDLSSGGFRRFSAGYLFEGGFSYSFDIGELYISLRYQRSLTTLEQSQKRGVNSYLDTLSAGFGFLFFL